MAKEIACRSTGIDCPFVLRTESDEELVAFSRQHGKDVSREDVMKMAKRV